MSSSTVYSLHYFNGRGRAETIRLIFTQAGQKFEDVCHTYDEGAKMKSKMPLGHLPVLEFSISIARYVARQFKLAGKDELESAKCDVIVDTIQELNDDYYRGWFLIKDEKEKEKEQTKFKTDILPEKLKGLENLMNTYGNGKWSVGNDVTWADLLLYNSIQNLLKIDEKLLKKYSAIKTNREAVKKLPKIAAYLAERKETAF